MGKTSFDSVGGTEETFHFYSPGAQTVGTKKNGFICPYAGTITDVRAYADTAPTVSALIADVNKNGVTVFTTQANRPSIAAGANASSTTLPDVTAVAAGDRVSYDVDAIGTVAGSDYYLSITIRRTDPIGVPGM